MVAEKNLRVIINFYEKLCLPVITWKKRYLSKQVVPITYTLEKIFFQPEFFLFRQSEKLDVYFGLSESSLLFQRRSYKYCLKK